MFNVRSDQTHSRTENVGSEHHYRSIPTLFYIPDFYISTEVSRWVSAQMLCGVKCRVSLCVQLSEKHLWLHCCCCQYLQRWPWRSTPTRPSPRSSSWADCWSALSQWVPSQHQLCEELHQSLTHSVVWNLRPVLIFAKALFTYVVIW